PREGDLAFCRGLEVQVADGEKPGPGGHRETSARGRAWSVAAAPESRARRATGAMSEVATAIVTTIACICGPNSPTCRPTAAITTGSRPMAPLKAARDTTVVIAAPSAGPSPWRAAMRSPRSAHRAPGPTSRTPSATKPVAGSAQDRHDAPSVWAVTTDRTSHA